MSKAARSGLIRFFAAMGIALGFGWIISEASFYLTRDLDRTTPQQIELVIPSGTASKVSAGEPVPAIPDQMVFLEGDVLLVRNDDTTNHQLGPVWVPPGKTGRLNLENPNLYTFACTFRPGNTFGLDVRPRATSWIKFQGVLAIGLPSGVLLWLYSLVALPLKKDSSGADV